MSLLSLGKFILKNYRTSGGKIAQTKKIPLIPNTSEIMTEVKVRHLFEFQIYHHASR